MALAQARDNGGWVGNVVLFVSVMTKENLWCRLREAGMTDETRLTAGY